VSRVNKWLGSGDRSSSSISSEYLRFIAPLLLVLLVSCTAFVAIGAAIS
jgi:hypothetical protein